MRRLKPATGLWKIQPQWVVRPRKQTNNSVPSIIKISSIVFRDETGGQAKTGRVKSSRRRMWRPLFSGMWYRVKYLGRKSCLPLRSGTRTQQIPLKYVGYVDINHSKFTKLAIDQRKQPNPQTPHTCAKSWSQVSVVNDGVGGEVWKRPCLKHKSTEEVC